MRPRAEEPHERDRTEHDADRVLPELVARPPQHPSLHEHPVTDDDEGHERQAGPGLGVADARDRLTDDEDQVGDQPLQLGDARRREQQPHQEVGRERSPDHPGGRHHEPAVVGRRVAELDDHEREAGRGQQDQCGIDPPVHPPQSRASLVHRHAGSLVHLPRLGGPVAPQRGGQAPGAAIGAGTDRAKPRCADVVAAGGEVSRGGRGGRGSACSTSGR